MIPLAPEGSLTPPPTGTTFSCPRTSLFPQSAQKTTINSDMFPLAERSYITERMDTASGGHTTLGRALTCHGDWSRRDLRPAPPTLIVTTLGHHDDPSVAYSNPALGHLRPNYGPRPRGSNYRCGCNLGDLDDGHSGGAVPLERSAYLDSALIGDNVDLESVPREVEEGVK